jgi:hypothetical protein
MEKQSQPINWSLRKAEKRWETFVIFTHLPCVNNPHIERLGDIQKDSRRQTGCVDALRRKKNEKTTSPRRKLIVTSAPVWRKASISNTHKVNG